MILCNVAEIRNKTLKNNDFEKILIFLTNFFSSIRTIYGTPIPKIGM
jgi:hypothetical protein